MKKNLYTGDGQPIRRGGWIEDAAGNLFEILAIKNTLEGDRVAIAIEILLDGSRSYRYGDMAETFTQADLRSCEAMWNRYSTPLVYRPY